MTFNIAILNHAAPGRAIALRRTLASFFENTDISFLYVKPEIWILQNGIDDEASKVIEEFSDVYNDFDWNVIENYENSGCSTGINQLWDATKEADFTLFIEGDWYLLPNRETRSWLKDTLDIMCVNADMNYVHLRAFNSAFEIRRYYESHEMFDLPVWRTFGNLKFRETRLGYMNNPHIRCNKYLSEVVVLPLMSVENETKDNEMWSRPEMEANAIRIQTWYLNMGLFEHQDEFSKNWSYFKSDTDNTLTPVPEVMKCSKMCGCECKYKFFYKKAQQDWCDMVCQSTSPDDYIIEEDKYINYKR